GSITAGMIWYGSFFGDHSQVNKFFGIPDHHVEADAGHGDAAEDHAAASDDHAAMVEEHHGSEEAHDMAEADPAHAVVAAVHHGKAPEGAIFHHPDNHVMDDAHHAPTWVKISPFVAMIIGFITAFWFYIINPSIPARLAASQRPLYLFLLNKWYFDEIYDAVFVKPASAIGRFLWKRGDGNVIDGTLNGIAMGIIPFFTRLAGKAQSGYVFTYALAMVLGIVALITWMSLSGGAH
ncbi:MAG: NADH-quinone oxidoreductase subunit L, partial [Paracoccaceae bacterium]|nr:NADH-quinone oxidoreductase subunit L [Paracoccaceae bacterium]